MNYGIRTIEDLRQRCHVPPGEDACWHWRGAISRGLPCMRLPALGHCTTSGAAICFLLTGEKPKPGKLWHRTCASYDCVNPAHRKVLSKSAATRRRGHKVTATTRALISQARKRIPDDVIQEIRLGTEHPHAAAARHGISVAYVYSIRSGKARRCVINSVFA